MKNAKKKILMLGNSHLVIFGFRGELITRLIQEGYEVVVSFPNGPFGEGEKTSKQYGCKFVEIPINRRGKNPIQELLLIKRYRDLVKQEKPDVVLAYTVKCDTYGGLACAMTKTPFIANITGIGKGLSEEGKLKSLVIRLYRAALKKAECVYFQNDQDEKFFIDNKICFHRSKMLPGSGVNLEKYIPLSYPKDDKVVFTYIARVMKAKGIEQFLDAAKGIKVEYPHAEFHICGYCEEDYKEIIDIEEKNGTVIYHGLVDNIIDYERLSHCIVLPSFHPEGISNVLLEAAACARPIITTNRAGCRETVNDGVTGYLVKERDSKDLINKMKLFLKLSYQGKMAMGIAGRKKIEAEFDRQIVVNEYLSAIEDCIVRAR